MDSFSAESKKFRKAVDFLVAEFQPEFRDVRSLRDNTRMEADSQLHEARARGGPIFADGFDYVRDAQRKIDSYNARVSATSKTVQAFADVYGVPSYDRTFSRLLVENIFPKTSGD